MVTPILPGFWTPALPAASTTLMGPLFVPHCSPVGVHEFPEHAQDTIVVEHFRPGSEMPKV